MGIGVNIHGFIECPGYAWQPEDKRIFRYNRRVIRQLPDSDSEWPFLTKNMFALLPLRSSLEQRIPQYENQLIHFAGSYKNMYVVEADWLVKFEGLLSRLCWYQAIVFNEFSRLRYEWRVELTDGIVEQFRGDPPRPPTQWSFQCFRFDCQPVPLREATDGVFTSSYHVAAHDMK